MKFGRRFQRFTLIAAFGFTVRQEGTGQLLKAAIVPPRLRTEGWSFRIFGGQDRSTREQGQRTQSGDYWRSRSLTHIFRV